MNANEMNEIEILQKIGARMREIRLEQNMKQKELAEKSGLSMFSIGSVRILATKRSPNWLVHHSTSSPSRTRSVTIL